jgi:hypothetical protein
VISNEKIIERKKMFGGLCSNNLSIKLRHSYSSEATVKNISS